MSRGITDMWGRKRQNIFMISRLHWRNIVRNFVFEIKFVLLCNVKSKILYCIASVLFLEKMQYNNTKESEKMCTRNELNLILKSMAQAYQAVYGENIVKIILYGSYARGDYQNNSDIDIVAIVQGEREGLQQELKKVWDISSDLELEYGIIISPTVIPFAEYEKYKKDLPYYRNIQNEGVEVVA